MSKLLLLTSFPSLDCFFASLVLQEILKFYQDNDLRPEHELPSTWLKTWLFRNSIRCSCIHNAFRSLIKSAPAFHPCRRRHHAESKEAAPTANHELISWSLKWRAEKVVYIEKKQKREMKYKRRERIVYRWILFFTQQQQHFFPVWHIYLISCLFYCCALSSLMHATPSTLSLQASQPASTRCMETLFCDKFIVVPFELSWRDEALFLLLLQNLSIKAARFAPAAAQV